MKKTFFFPLIILNALIKFLNLKIKLPQWIPINRRQTTIITIIIKVLNSYINPNLIFIIPIIITIKHKKLSSSSSQLSSTNMDESKFYSLSIIEVKDQLEIVLEEAFLKLQYPILNSSSSATSSDTTSFNEV